MLYETLGRLHARVAWALRAQSGQGTVEYVGLLLLLATLLTAVVAAVAKSKDAGIAELITKKLKEAMNVVKPRG
ncbi:MAG: hypothetical protein M3P39_10155 [Actinomycetota bacterium]|nr:hypothetical protein [Actinomycetota bacterium]